MSVRHLCPWPAMALVGLAFALGVPRAGAQQPAPTQQDAAPAVEPDEFFENQVRPLLVDNCYACHADSKMGELRLDSREAMLKGGKSGPAILPGEPDGSLLIRAVRQVDERLKMPLGRKLEAKQVAILTEWIRMGAPWPEAHAQPVPAPTVKESTVKESTGKEFNITAAQKSFWSFQPLREPEPPAAPANDSWARTPIDRFVLAKLEEQGLQPVQAADRRTLIRRATLDLTGLPPTPQEVDAFVNDPSPRAFETVIDRLLASPRYGERWARYWLDVVRYGESDVRGAVPAGFMPYDNAFRYRDWVIQAFNQDMPYDRFIKDQLAADFLPEKEREEALPALGMLGLGPWYWDLTEPPIARADERHDRVDLVTRGILGVTVACARCHDHKYDPFSTKDYYALAGVFSNTRYAEHPLVTPEVVEAYQNHEKKIKKQEKLIKDLLAAQSNELAEMLLHHTARYLTAAWRVMGPQKEGLVKAAKAESVDFQVLQRWLDYLAAPHTHYPYLKDWQGLLARGGTLEEARKVGAALQETAQAILEEKKDNDKENQIRVAGAAKHDSEDILTPDFFQTYDQFCPRCDVAMKSLATEKYYLWSDLLDKQQAEGEGKGGTGALVFKDCELEELLSTEWKSHIELLRSDLAALKKSLPAKYPLLHVVTDASEIKELQLVVRGNPNNLGEQVPRHFPAVLSGGEPKPFTQGSGRLELAEALVRHPLTARVIVNRVWQAHFGRGIVGTPSNFGQVGDRPTHPELLEYLAARFVKEGMSIKSLQREIMLSATYQLGTAYSADNYAKDAADRYLWRFSGRRLDAESLRDSLLFVSGGLDQNVGGPSLEWNMENKRRTVYGKISRFRLASYLALFDFPDPGITNEKRNITLVPLQRLFFLNSDFVLKQADQLALRVAAQGDNEARIRGAYRILYGREPSEAELKLGLEFLDGADVGKDVPSAAWRQYARVLLSSNEFSLLN